MHGIEINPYAYELAQTTIWIGYIQWWRDNGFGLPEEPILKPLEAIRQMDAIMAYDADGKPVEPEWPEADVIVGNPPFLGSKKMRRELGEAYVNDLVRLYSDRLPPKSDLVCYWFERARELVEDRAGRRCGLLATQAIRNGLNRTVLDAIKQSGDIFMAYGDRLWILEGAAVQVSIVCFDDGTEKNRELDGRRVEFINSDLTSALNMTSARRLLENCGLAFSGTKKYGPFDINHSTAQELLAAVGNPNGRPNSDVVKPWVNGIDIAQSNRRMSIIDFGVDTTLEEAALYEKPFEYVARFVRPAREHDKDANTRDRWWLFQRPRPEMRAALAGLNRFIATPAVSKHRFFVWLNHPTVPDQQLAVIARSDDYFFGVLQSRLHEPWARANASQLRDAISGTRYTLTTTFETFPFPWPPGQEPADDPRVEAIAEAAQALVAQRDAWLHPAGASEAELQKRTLTNLYNARPTWLDLAHRKLDAAVLDAYGWPHDLSDKEILAHLLALNFERTAADRNG